MNNKEWSERILQKIDPSFKHRWELFDRQIKNHLSLQTTWLDCGCGDNATVQEFGHLAKRAIGLDIIRHENVKGPFVMADIKQLPIADHSVDLVTLRFVVEHFDAKQAFFDELKRVLKPGGKVILVTTNIWSPFIFMPRILLPYKVKHAIITRIFKVADEDIFPTYHQVNSYKALRNIKGFSLTHFEYISDLNYTRKWMFLIFLSWHVFTKTTGMKFLRTNIIAVLHRTEK